ncbi:MAG: hypothetical protein AB8C13_02610 [Phycisphaerales bacterium]
MPGPTGPSPRMIGFTIASIMFVVFAIIVWTSMNSGSAASSPSQSVFENDPGEVPDLSDIEQGASMFVTITDRDDPTRIAGTMRADQFEPIGGGQRRLVNPDAWIFMRDGTKVHITADDGLVTMPDPNQAPESGTLQGDVTITAFDAGVLSDEPSQSEIDQAPASMTAVFDQPVEFERRYQRLTSLGRFEIDSPSVEFIGHHLTVMLNEVKGRVELIDVRKGERLVLRPNARSQDVDESVDPVSSNADEDSAESIPSNAAAVEDEVVVAQSVDGQDVPASETETTFETQDTLEADTALAAANTQGIAPVIQDRKPYYIQLQQDVQVDLVGRGNLTSDHLDIWAMLIDGGLSEDAIKQIQFVTESQVADPDSADTELGEASELVDASNAAIPSEELNAQPALATSDLQDSKQTDPESQEGDVVITWSGPLVVKPIEDPQTTPLIDDELAMEFVSAGLVEFVSVAQEFKGAARSVRYGATRGVLELTGEQGDGVTLTASGAGALRAGNLIADLGRGIIDIDSSGQLESVATPDAPRAQIDWATSAQFGLVVSETGELSARLKYAGFEGEVLGQRADAVVRSASLIAELDEEGPLESALRQIALTEGSMRSDSGSLTGNQIDIGFVPVLDESTVTPSSLSANGAVLGVSADGRIEADQLSAVLVRDPDGGTRVRRATAIGNTDFLGERDTRAQGHRVEVDTDNDTIHLLGDGKDLATAGQAGSVIQGGQIWINTRSRSIRVDGPGTFDHDIVTQGVATGGHLRVNWNESMRFDDARGSIECRGDVVAVSTPDAYTLDTLKADRLEIDLTPAPGTDQIINPDALAVDDGVDRELYQARAFGKAVPGGKAVPASVESKTYDPANPEFSIGVMYLEGAQLIADNRSQMLRVPSRGMMVLMDRSQSGENELQVQASSSTVPTASGPGITRMTWAGSMQLNRVSGNAQVLSDVNIRHKSLTTNRISELACDQLDAEFTGQSAALSANESISTQPAPITMKRATVNGRVRFSDLQRTLLSDHAIYDAIAGTVYAYADEDRLVTLRDSISTTPTSARTLLWDLNRDLVEIDAPSPIRAPARP